jgi:hypothetical protein
MSAIRSAPTKVVVFQWPCGTLIRSRWPRAMRPWRRAILVDAPVSSMKTEPLGVEIVLGVEPGLTAAQDVGTVLLRPAPGLFLGVMR